MLCPTCLKGTVNYGDDRITCSTCGAEFSFKDDVPVMLDPLFSKDILDNVFGANAWEEYDSDSIGKKIARHSTVKKSVWQRIIPYSRVQIGPRFKDFIENYSIEGNILELGGGPASLGISGSVNLDINSYPSVDVVGDARRLPFQSNSFGAIISNSVLEHIWEVELVVNECYRVTKPSGFIFICVPQVCGRHHTTDYHRWTLPGLIRLFDRFEVIQSGVVLGPGMFFSHLITNISSSTTNSKLLKSLLGVALEWVFFPVRFLDFMGRNSNEQENYAHTIYMIGRKRAESAMHDHFVTKGKFCMNIGHTA